MQWRPENRLTDHVVNARNLTNTTTTTNAPHQGNN